MATSAQVTFNQGVSFDEVIDIQSVMNDALTADVIVLCLGEAPESEGEGNINDLTLSAPQLELYDALKTLNVPIVLALVEARPRILNQAAGADAIFMCYLPGPMGGEAFADLLFGQVSPYVDRFAFSPDFTMLTSLVDQANCLLLILSILGMLVLRITIFIRM